ncbi:hypothetical protein SLEP1_g21871 [Rubroshorea leprosula]|uniref:Uncharacterized protein n=1 Tax=Rubroshorea leprosula TaxID=152421 RepID=A0AAV5JGQ3_9ROSI|nr:hypothetical protein SLEP1_g21871 [Rubroshorea leprosula]
MLSVLFIFPRIQTRFTGKTGAWQSILCLAVVQFIQLPAAFPWCLDALDSEWVFLPSK